MRLFSQTLLTGALDVCSTESIAEGLKGAVLLDPVKTVTFPAEDRGGQVHLGSMHTGRQQAIYSMTVDLLTEIPLQRIQQPSQLCRA